VRENCRVVEVPVTADIEAGYGESPMDVAATVRHLLDAGIVGINLEDGGPKKTLVPVAEHVRKLLATRGAARAAGLPLVINARIDVYWLGVGEPAHRLAEAVRRARAYRDAGADCIFLPGITDPATIAELVSEIDIPLNILAGPGAPSSRQLEALGVRRVSAGSAPSRAVFGLIARMAEELRRHGTYESMRGGVPYEAMNAMMLSRVVEPDL
jgi:2-methylisocitrate lyase-like PEP mutase family enzyme